MKFSARMLTSGLCLLVLSAISHAQSTFAFQGLYAGNNGAFTSVDGNGGETTSAQPFRTSKDFTGLDSHGHTQTMNISGSAFSNVTYGHIHVAGQGSITNPYFNSTNSPYFDGTLDPNGSPDLLAINGNAGFSDILTYGSPTAARQPGYKVNFYFRLEGSVSGDTLAGLNFSTSDPTGESYNPRTHQSHEIWVTPFYNMEWDHPLTINADFFAGFNTQVSAHPEGVNYSGSAQYGNTLDLIGMTVIDPSGNQVTDFSVSSGSGTNYSTTPEPGTWLALGLGGLAVMRRKRR